jgi:hypothetical protein
MTENSSAIHIARSARAIDVRDRVGRKRVLRSAALADWELGMRPKRVFEFLLTLFDWQTGFSGPISISAMGRILGIGQLQLRLALSKLLDEGYITIIDSAVAEGRAICASFPGLVDSGAAGRTP